MLSKFVFGGTADFEAATPFVLMRDPYRLSYLKIEPLLNIRRDNSLPNDRAESRGHVMIVIPKPDHWLGKLVLIAERAQAGRGQEKIPAR